MEFSTVLSTYLIILLCSFYTYQALGIDGLNEQNALLNNFTYFFLFTPNKQVTVGTYNEARNACLNHKADLMSITAQSEQELISELAQNNNVSEGIWINRQSVSKFENWGPFQKVQFEDLNETCISSVIVTKREKSLFSFYHGYSVVELEKLGGDFAHIKENTFKVNMTHDQNACVAICQNEGDCLLFTVIPNISNHSLSGHLCIRSNSSNIDRLFHVPNASSGFRNTSYTGRESTGSWLVENCSAKHPFICQAPIIDYSRYDCPDGYFQLRKTEKCYKIHTIVNDQDGVTWDKAREICRQGPGRNPDLASFHSVLDIAEVVSQIQDYVWGMWIGYHYSSITFKWAWVDGYHSNYTNWAEIVPTYRSYGCAEMITSPGIPGSWNIVGCYQKRGYICETYKEQNSKSMNNVNVSESPCKEGWVHYNDACYVSKKETLSWEEAEALCLSYGANLASVHSEAENAFILGMFSSLRPLWIGFSQNPDSEFLWTDGWPVTFSKWSSNGIEELGKCCFMASNGTWMLSLCSQQRHFVCKYSLVKKPPVIEAVDGVCPSDQWMKWGGHCYYFWVPSNGEPVSYSWQNKDSTYKFSWPEGQRICRAIAPEIFHSNLASIENRLENAMLVNQVKKIMKKFSGHTTVWIGLHRNGTGAQFENVDHSPLQYDPWAPGEPNSPELATQCVEMRLDVWTGAWNDHPCSEKTYFICKSDIVDETVLEEISKKSEKESKCPTAEWKEFKGNCYFIRPFDMLNWVQATEECQKLSYGETPVVTSIHDAEENYFIQSELIRQKGSISSFAVWIGLHKAGPFKQNPYKWVDGSVLVFQNWADHEPNDVHGVENCVELSVPSGEWNDNNCNEQKGYVCKVKQKEETNDNKKPSSSTSRKVDILYGVLVMVGLVVIAIIVAVSIDRLKKRTSKTSGDYENVLFQNNPTGE